MDTKQEIKDAYRKWLVLLFDRDDKICLGANAYSTSLIRRDAALELTPLQFTAINPMMVSRADRNVTKYRSILLEFDTATINKQRRRIIDSGIPFTSIVYSGGKSLHLIISLEEPMEDALAYSRLVSTIYDAMDPNEIWLDRTCKNPSRFTRTPEAVRVKGDIEVIQTCVELKSRVNNNELHNWITSRLGVKETAMRFTEASKGPPRINLEQILNKLKKQPDKNLDVRHNNLSRRAEAFLTWGAEQNWLTEAYYTASELARCGFEEEEIIEKMERVDGYLDNAALTAIKNAFRNLLRAGDFGSKLK